VTFRVLVAAIAIAAMSQPLRRFEYRQPHMGTMMRIVLYGPLESDAKQAANAAFARIAALDETLSDYRDSSELMRVSQAAGGPPVPVSADLFRVLHAAQALARSSGGAFDVTAGPLTILWRAARRQRALPDADDLQRARVLVGDAKMELDEARQTVRLRDAGMQLDVGGIAKGFAADEAAAVLAARRFKRVLVAAGGDIVAGDPPPGRDGWVVAVVGLGPSAVGSVTLRNQAVSTSGDAEQHFEANGVRYSHIVDPRTGQALVGRSSVTVIARNGISSDSLATALSVMETRAGLRLVDGIKGASARISTIDADGQLKTSSSSRWRQR
jgi:thiamine biosynthesis lipoprotein